MFLEDFLLACGGGMRLQTMAAVLGNSKVLRRYRTRVYVRVHSYHNYNCDYTTHPVPMPWCGRLLWSSCTTITEWGASQGQRVINSKDKGIFWMGVYVAPLAWVLLIVLAVFRFTIDYLLIAVIGIILSGTNLYGYYKCSKEQKKKMENYARGFMTQGIMNAFNRFV
mmetsp:Transcript_26976/g.76015  ORF Transcript_26976/g.76015 Transcript_26976/m.76015 type:complete len:167 (-) Transcript_26976:52-552(-)